LGYRSRQEASPWLERDALPRIECLLPPEACSRLKTEVEEEIMAAIRFAEESPFPEPAELFMDVIGD
jgi:TPP-dependent pyruvate/acetoin dehydrogenase alpha subunit